MVEGKLLPTGDSRNSTGNTFDKKRKIILCYVPNFEAEMSFDGKGFSVKAATVAGMIHWRRRYLQQRRC